MAGAFAATTFDEYAFDVDYTSSSAVFVSVGGIQRATHRTGDGKVLHGSLTVVDIINETPNTCTFRAMGFTPTVGQRVLVSLGGATNPSRLFAGTVLTVQQSYVGSPDNPQYMVSCADDTWKLGQIKVTTRYTAQSATDIVEDLIDTYAPDFTTDNVAAALESIDEITFTNEDLATCLTRLAKRIGGYWYVDEFEDIHFFISETGDDPDDLTDSNPYLQNDPPFSVSRDISQMVTRVRGEGGGSNLLSDIEPGETIAPVVSLEYFNPLGGEFASGPQRCTYDALEPGDVGSLVGPGAAPASAPVLALAAGSGVDTGDHDVTVVFRTAAGPSIAGPLATLEVGFVPPPASAPVAGAPTIGAGPDVGAHYYAITEVTAAGETTPSPVSNTVTTNMVAAPSSAPVLAEIIPSAGNFEWLVGASIRMAVAYFRSSGETTIGPMSNTVVATAFAPFQANCMDVSSIPVSSDPSVTSKRLYVEINGSWAGYYTLAASVTTTPTNISGVTFATDDTPSGSNTTTYAQVPLSGLPVASSLGTARKLYGTAAGGAQLKLVATLNTTDTTYLVTTVDASLGANAPGSNTAAANQIAVSGIPIGPATTTSRELYMSEANDPGGQRRLALSIANNTATTGTITISDATLAGEAAEPTSDTSGLAQPAGQVVAGATTVPVAGPGLMPAAGWAVIGNGQQVIRYTGKSSTALTGVPASGVGSIVATIGYGSSITAPPQLTGIPASGAGEVLFACAKGDEINLSITEDDAAAQAVLAAYIGSGDGVVEEFIQDRRLTELELRARAQAVLALRGIVEASVTYQIRGDRNHRSGRTVVVDLPSPTSVDQAFKIQSVRISDFQPGLDPVFDVEASTNRFSFENLLSMARRN